MNDTMADALSDTMTVANTDLAPGAAAAASATAAPPSTAAGVATAIGVVDRALLQYVLLDQRVTLNDESLRTAAQVDDPAGRAAAFLQARGALNAVLRSQVADAQAVADALAWPFLSRVFGTTMPGYVTLPSTLGGRPIRERVTALISLRDGDGELSGVVRTSSDDGRINSTRAFYTTKGAPFFCDDYGF